jgi:hypothetical protein
MQTCPHRTWYLIQTHGAIPGSNSNSNNATPSHAGSQTPINQSRKSFALVDTGAGEGLEGALALGGGEGHGVASLGAAGVLGAAVALLLVGLASRGGGGSGLAVNFHVYGVTVSP